MEKKSVHLKRARKPVTSEVANLGEPSSKVQKLDQRFDFNITSNDLTRFMEGEIPANTERSTSWAVKIFEDWRKA